MVVSTLPRRRSSLFKDRRACFFEMECFTLGTIAFSIEHLCVCTSEVEGPVVRRVAVISGRGSRRARRPERGLSGLRSPTPGAGSERYHIYRVPTFLYYYSWEDICFGRLLGSG